INVERLGIDLGDRFCAEQVHEALYRPRRNVAAVHPAAQGQHQGPLFKRWAVVNPQGFEEVFKHSDIIVSASAEAGALGSGAWPWTPNIFTQPTLVAARFFAESGLQIQPIAPDRKNDLIDSMRNSTVAGSDNFEPLGARQPRRARLAPLKHCAN